MYCLCLLPVAGAVFTVSGDGLERPAVGRVGKGTDASTARCVRVHAGLWTGLRREVLADSPVRGYIMG